MGSYKLSLDYVVLKTGAFFDVSESTIINIANNSPTNKPTTTPPTNSPTNKPPTTAPKKKKKKKKEKQYDKIRVNEKMIRYRSKTMHIWCYKNIYETTQYDYTCSIKCLIMFFYFIFLFGFCYNIIKII